MKRARPRVGPAEVQVSSPLPPGHPSEEFPYQGPSDLSESEAPNRLVSISERQLSNLVAMHRAAVACGKTLSNLRQGSGADLDFYRDIKRYFPKLEALCRAALTVEDEALLAKRGL